MQKTRGNKKIIFAILVLIILVVAAIAGGLFYYKKVYSKPVDVSEKVAKLIELPAETPKITTVSDVNKYISQPFFAHAQNGDKLLIYPKAKRAILYRPSVNKIIEVAFYDPTRVSVTPTNAAKSIRVAVYNGTKMPGLAKSQAASLASKYPNIDVVITSNSMADYTSNLVIDLTGKNADFAKTLAGELKGKVSTLPSVEAKPEADIVIILGEE